MKGVNGGRLEESSDNKKREADGVLEVGEGNSYNRSVDEVRDKMKSNIVENSGKKKLEADGILGISNENSCNRGL